MYDINGKVGLGEIGRAVRYDVECDVFSTRIMLEREVTGSNNHWNPSTMVLRLVVLWFNEVKTLIRKPFLE